MAGITITIKNNGPFFISPEDAASLTLLDQEGNPVPLPEGKVIKLCRCGGSSKKPFCDGQHSKIGFQGAIAAVEAAAGQGTAESQGDGTASPR